MSSTGSSSLLVDADDPSGTGGPRLADSDLGHLRRVLVEIKKALKTAMFNRHRADSLDSYIAPAHGLLTAFLSVHKVCELSLEVSTFAVDGTPLFEDDAADNNIIYPLWAAGIRLLIFKEGVTAADLLRFFMAVVEHKRAQGAEDLATHLWKQDIRGIEWVVVADFEIGDEGGEEAVEVEVEKVLSYVQDQLRSDSTDSIGFARVSVDDLELKLEQLDQLRQTVVAKQTVDTADRRSVQAELGADERDLLRRICNILLEVVRLPATVRELTDLEQAFEQLVDALVLEGQFSMVDRLVEQCDVLARDLDLPTANRDTARSTSERVLTLMSEGQRVRAVGTALNAGLVKDLEGLRRYLTRLGASATLLLLDLLDVLNAAPHRRLVADVLVMVGLEGVPMFARRLATASSNVAKDLLYVIDQIDPPNKVELFAPILLHENAVLRMEGLTTIGRTHDDVCFRIIADVFRTHDVPQMRAHAARILADYPAAWCEPVLLAAANDPKLELRPDGEKRALIAALVKVDAPAAQAWVRSLFAEKSRLFAKKKADERKLMAIGALAGTPGLPAIQLLVEVAKADKLHSKEVREAAHGAALEMKRRLLGAEAS